MENITFHSTLMTFGGTTPLWLLLVVFCLLLSNFLILPLNLHWHQANLCLVLTNLALLQQSILLFQPLWIWGICYWVCSGNGAWKRLTTTSIKWIKFLPRTCRKGPAMVHNGGSKSEEVGGCGSHMPVSVRRPSEMLWADGWNTAEEGVATWGRCKVFPNSNVSAYRWWNKQRGSPFVRAALPWTGEVQLFLNWYIMFVAATQCDFSWQPQTSCAKNNGSGQILTRVKKKIQFMW